MLAEGLAVKDPEYSLAGRRENSRRASSEKADSVRLLFVDDEATIRLTLPPLLEKRGFEVRIAADVPQALLEVNSSRFDVLICDLNIQQEGDGFLVVSAMRHLQPHCVNIILTGYPALETALKAIQNRVDDYLAKPADLEALLESIHSKLKARNGGLLPTAATAIRDERSFEVNRPTRPRPGNGQAERHGRERDMRELTGTLLQIRDDERRKLARDLHDSVGQQLAALSINLSFVKAADGVLSPQAAKALAEAERLAQQVTKEVRTVSHLLHPPLLEEAGLASAIRWYLDGYAERSSVAVELDIPEKFGRLSPELETVIFRIVQESLTNIHRHSGSPGAKIRMARDLRQVVVEIKDSGKGIPTEKLAGLESGQLPGVGLRGMRERVRQFRGTFTIRSSARGTLIGARFPV